MKNEELKIKNEELWERSVHPVYLRDEIKIN